MGFGKDGKGIILWDVTDITLGALASKDVVRWTADASSSITEDFRIIKTEYFMTFAPGAFDSLEGPILVGISAGGLSDSEIEEAIESNPTDNNDYPAIEQTMRPVWPLENFVVMQNSTTANVGSHVIAKGDCSIRWTMSDSDGWSWWVYNNSGAALTTGGFVHIVAKHYGVWVV